MTPNERDEFNTLKREVVALREAADPILIAALSRYFAASSEVPRTLNDLSDVDTSGVSNNQVIKYDSSSQIWENANDIDT